MLFFRPPATHSVTRFMGLRSEQMAETTEMMLSENEKGAESNIYGV